MRRRCNRHASISWPASRTKRAPSSARSDPTRLRKTLVAAQVALSFLLLVGSGLFARTLANLKHADIGLQSIDHLVTFGLNPAKSGYTVPQLRRFYDDVLREVRATPDVDAAAFTWMPLLQGWAPGWHTRVEGHVAKEGENVEIEDNIVSPDYWRTMGIKVVEGRDFDARDAFDPSAGAKEPTSRSSIGASPSGSSATRAPSDAGSASASTRTNWASRSWAWSRIPCTRDHAVE